MLENQYKEGKFHVPTLVSQHFYLRTKLIEPDDPGGFDKKKNFIPLGRAERVGPQPTCGYKAKRLTFAVAVTAMPATEAGPKIKQHG